MDQKSWTDPTMVLLGGNSKPPMLELLTLSPSSKFAWQSRSDISEATFETVGLKTLCLGPADPTRLVDAGYEVWLREKSDITWLDDSTRLLLLEPPYTKLLINLLGFYENGILNKLWEGSCSTYEDT